MKKIIALIMVITLFTGCGAMVEENEAIQTLTDAGYSNVQVIDNHWVQPIWFGCSDSDATAFECIATNLQGDR